MDGAVAPATEARDGAGLVVDLTDRTNNGETESKLGRIDNMCETIGEDEANTGDGSANNGTLLDCFVETL